MDNVAEVFRNKFATYRKLLDEADEKTAWDTLFNGYPERQKVNMGPKIEGTTLTAGFSSAIPNYKKMGMEMVIHDISNNGQDAVLEIQKACPILDNGWHTEFSFEKPCHIVCEMDIAATEAAFPNIKGSILARMADGNCVCLFKYERPK
jgi:hypothetical protein